MKVGDVLTGSPVSDWRFYKDNGNATDYLVEFNASSTVSVGEGYWLITKGTFSFSSTLTMPQLAADGSYSIGVRTGWNIIRQRVTEAVGAEAAQTITPHSFRHYFVTTVLRASGGNLKMAQELARHKNIAVTQRYAHLSDDELDRGYSEIFDE